MKKETLSQGWRSFVNIMQSADLRLPRLSLGFGSIVWGLLLFWPGDTFGPTRHTYSLMAQFADETTWAAMFLCQGIVTTYAVLYERRERYFILFDSITTGFLWTASCVMMLMAYLPYSPPPAAISAEIIMACMSWWFVVRSEYGIPPTRRMEDRRGGC